MPPRGETNYLRSLKTDNIHIRLKRYRVNLTAKWRESWCTRLSPLPLQVLHDQWIPSAVKYFTFCCTGGTPPAKGSEIQKAAGVPKGPWSVLKQNKGEHIESEIGDKPNTGCEGSLSPS